MAVSQNLVPIVIEKSGRTERAYDIFSRLLKDRIVFLGGPVDDVTANLIIAHRGEAAIRLKQIATVIDGLEDNRKLARYNDQPCVSIGIVKVTGSNTVAIVNAVKEKLGHEIIPQLPSPIPILSIIYN